MRPHGDQPLGCCSGAGVGNSRQCSGFELGGKPSDRSDGFSLSSVQLSDSLWQAPCHPFTERSLGRSQRLPPPRVLPHPSSGGSVCVGGSLALEIFQLKDSCEFLNCKLRRMQTMYLFPGSYAHEFSRFKKTT